MKYLILRLVALVSLVSSSAMAWGPDGHSAIAEIAERNLLPQTEKVLSSIMGEGVSLASGSGWADVIRNTRPETKRWHFVDMPIAETEYDPTRDCKLTSEGDCLVAAIERLQKKIDPTQQSEDQRETLKFIVHLIGDIHQPMHTVLDEEGATRVEVIITAKGATTPNQCTNHCPRSNLHAVWDSGLIHAETWNWGQLVDIIESQSPPSLPSKDYNLIGWTNETHLVAIDMWNLAHEKMAPDSKHYIIDQAYLTVATPVLHQQVYRAGMRLANFLNCYYGQSQQACAAVPAPPEWSWKKLFR